MLTKRWAAVIGLVVLVGLLSGGLLIAGAALAQGPSPRTPQGGWGPGGMMGGWGGRGTGGMMGGWWGYPSSGSTQGVTSTVPSGFGWDGGMMGGGMMGGWGNPGTGTPITGEQATQAATAYIAAYGNPDLELGEVMEFSSNFYAQARERSTGRPAFELLVDRYTGATHPEPGPNMMWNTKYGHMGGMMGGMMGGWWSGRPAGDMTVTPQQAHDLAQQYLSTNLPGTSVEEGGDTFYGYYTLEILRNGQTAGMLSVNGYTGQVWYHTWHGDFIREVRSQG